MSGFAEKIVGLQLGPYQVRRLIARGGMGIVYEGYQPSLERVVAVKVLYPHLSDDPAFVERFQREARAVARLSHPHIVQMIDYGSDQGYQYMVMDYVTGGSLRQLLAEQGRLPLDRALGILVQVGSALAWAHRRGVVHRDVKPGNILLDEDGSVKLSDFGLVKLLDTVNLTVTGTTVGTPEYMAPEQSDISSNVGPAADQYSLAVVAYELLLGQAPFKAPTPAAMIQKHVYEPPPPPSSLDPSIPPAAEAALLRALSKDPVQRFPSVDEFVRALVAGVGVLPAGVALPLSQDSPALALTPTQSWTATPPPAETTAPVQPVATEGPAPVSAPPTAATPAPVSVSAPATPAASVEPAPAATGGGRSRWPLLAIAALVVALAGGAAGFAFFSGGGGGDSPTPTAQANQGGTETTPEATPGDPTATSATEPTATTESAPTATVEAAQPTATVGAVAPTATAGYQATATQVIISRPIAPTPTSQQITVGDSDTTTVIQSTFDNGEPSGFYVGTNDYGNSGAVADAHYTLSVVDGGWQSIGQNVTSSLLDGIVAASAQLQGDGAVGLSARSRTLDDGTFVLYACWLGSNGQAGCSEYVNNAWSVLFTADVPDLNAGDFHNLAMAMVGNEIQFTIDGGDIGRVTVTGDAQPGYWGFYAESNSGAVTAVYDSVIIARVNS